MTHREAWPLAAAYGSAALAIATLAALFTLHRLYDFDILWHLRTGEWILANGAIPRTDPFGGRTADIPWLDVAWGFQAAAAALVRWCGLPGLQLVVAGMVAATLLVVLARAPRTPLVLAGAVLFVIACWLRFRVRPDVLALPLTLLAMALLERLPERRRSTLVLLGLLTAAWANVHGSFILVPLLLLAGAAGSALSADRAALRTHGIALVVVLAAPFANPRGPAIYEVLAPYARSMLAAVGVRPAEESLLISEWTPTWSALIHDAIFPTTAFALLVALVALSFVVRGGGIPAARLARSAAMLALALTAVRNVLPFGAVALYIIARNEEDRLGAAGGAADAGARADGDNPLDAGWFRLSASIAILLVTATFLYAVVSDRYYVDREMPIVTGAGIDLDLVPEGAVQWLATHEPPGRLFNNYDSGAWLLYRLGPAVPNYIDSRFDVTTVNREIERAMRDPASFDALVERDGIGTVVLVHPSPESVTLLPRLAGDPRWTLAFRDANSTVHVRSEASPVPPRTQPLSLSPAVEPAADRVNALLAPWKCRVLPVAERTDAYVSSILGDRERERDAWRRALERAPDDPQALEYFAREGTAPANPQR